MTRKPLAGAACAFALAALLGGCSAAPDAQQPAANDAEKTEQSDQAASSDGVADKGDDVKVHYRGTLEDGTQFDSSYDRGEPLSFTVGAGQMISGFDKAVEGMKVGEKKTVTLQPSEAYGEVDKNLVLTFPKDEVPDFDSLKVGDSIMLQSSNGPVQAKVTDKTADKITVDANHELAGKPLTFEIELVESE